MQKNKKLRVFLKWGLFLKNQNVFSPVWTPGIMITIIVWDTLWIFQKCYSPQSRVINSLTRGSRLARPLTGLSTNAKSFIRCCKDKPIARGGPIKFRSPFWKEKNRQMSHLLPELFWWNQYSWCIPMDARCHFLSGCWGLRRRRMAWYTKHFTN